jgi:acyl carrier protein
LTAFGRSIEQAMGWKLEPSVFLQHGTIAGLAGHLKELKVSRPELLLPSQAPGTQTLITQQESEPAILNRTSARGESNALPGDDLGGSYISQVRQSSSQFTFDPNPAQTVEENVRRLLIDFLTRQLKVPSSKLDPNTCLLDYGLDSIAALKLAHAIEEAFRTKLSHRGLWEHFSYESLAKYLVTRLPNEMQAITQERATPGSFGEVAAFGRGARSMDAAEAVSRYGGLQRSGRLSHSWNTRSHSL